MRFRKVYGQSKEENCVFCGKQGLQRNKQGFAVCRDHKEREMEDKRCVCGELMQVKESKWGAFFLCPQCGPISLKKVDELGDGPFKLNKRFRKENKPDLKPENPVTMNYPDPAVHKDTSPAIKASRDTTNKKTSDEGQKKVNEKKSEKEKVYTLDELKMLWD